MSKIDRDINDAMRNPKTKVEPLPCAWELRIRMMPPKTTPWKRYAIYETHERAMKTMKTVEGPPIEVKIVPLYAEIEVD